MSGIATYSITDLLEYILGNCESVLIDERIELVEGEVHYFHANPNVALTKQSTVKLNCEGTVRSSH
jgi:hypothetical protein